MTIKLQRKVRKRWRAVRTLRQDGKAGKNRLRVNPRARAAMRKPKRVRYRVQAYAVDVVGNRSTPVRLRVSAAAAKKLRRR